MSRCCSGNSTMLPGLPGPMGPAGPSGISVTDITWAALDALATASTMVEGYYRITDFRTYYLIPNTATYFTGVTEPLIVFATSPSTLAREAWSALNPTDIIHYVLVAPTANEGDRGMIEMRKSVTLNIQMPYDFRNVKYRRWESSAGSGIYNQLTDPGAGAAFQDAYSITIGSSLNFIWEAPPCILSNNILKDMYNVNIHCWEFRNNTTTFIYETSINVNSFTNNYISGGIIGSNFILSNFNTNIIPNIYYCNFTGNSFQTNTFNALIRSNNFNIGNRSLTATNFAASTHVYADYNCEIFSNATPAFRLSYYNAADALNVVLITA